MDILEEKLRNRRIVLKKQIRKTRSAYLKMKQEVKEIDNFLKRNYK